MTNTNLLKSKMVAEGDENFVQCLTELLGCSRPTASKKLRGEVEFTQEEIIIIAKRYHLSADDIKAIFVGDE